MKKKGLNPNNEIEELDPLSLLENIDYDDNTDDKDYAEKEEELKKTEISKNTNTLIDVKLRTLLCSATIETVHKKKKKNKEIKEDSEQDNDKVNLENLIRNLKFYNKLIYLRHNPNELDQDDKKSFILPTKLETECFKCDSLVKDYYLFHILKENEDKKVIVFSNSISHTKKLYSIFSYFDFKMVCLHSKMQQSQRMKYLDKFREGNSNILFCTDVGARGLDIPSVDLVIHYHIPKMTENFIHRSGRTARAHQGGKTISLISENEMNLYKKILKDLKIKEFYTKSLNIAQIEKYKSLFEYAKSVEKDEYTIKKKNREKQWFEKTARDCDLILDDEESDDDKFLNKKKKKYTQQKISSKKIYHNIISKNVRMTSFLTPDMISNLNSLINNDNKLNNINLTAAIDEAKKDSQFIKHKGKERKKRYLRRRKK